jgi:hypothetical protein
MAHYKVVILVCLFLFAASAGSAMGLRVVVLKDRDLVTVKGQRLQCVVTRANINCTETGGWPRLSFHASTTGGDADKGEFFIYRQEQMVSQWFMLTQMSRRK